MLNRVIDLSVRGRWLVLLLVLVLAVFGARELLRLPIDAVPDITNKQVQINTIAPALGPEEVEREVTFPLETALAGLPGLTETRSLSRHGFSQITAIFTDATDIYFARNLVNERLQSARQDLPEGLSPTTGPVVTGLGEVATQSAQIAAHRRGADFDVERVVGDHMVQLDPAHDARREAVPAERRQEHGRPL